MNYIRRENIGDIGYADGKCVLLRNGIQQEKDAAVFDFRTADEKELSAPLSIFINVTDNCQLNCGFCFYPYRSYGRVMEKETADAVCNYIEKHIVYEIDILGGEPLHETAVDLTIYLLQKLYQIDCLQKCYLTTNGVNRAGMEKLLNEAYSEKLQITVSLQTYHRMDQKNGCIQSIELLEKRKIPYTIASVVSRQSTSFQAINELLNQLQYCQEWRWYFPNLYISNPLFEAKIPRMEEYQAWLAEERKLVKLPIAESLPPAYNEAYAKPPKDAWERMRRRCSGMGRKMEILPDGSVIPCAILPETYISGKITDPEFVFQPMPERWNECAGCKSSGHCLYCPAAKNGKRHCPEQEKQGGI